jgi:hypothetical protein
MEGRKQPRTGQGLKRVQILLFPWQIEPFRKICHKSNLSFAEGIRILVSNELLDPAFDYSSPRENDDLHFEARKKVEE